MAEVTTNLATGEVSFRLNKKKFRLHATMPRLAAFQASVRQPGLGAIEALLRMHDAQAIYFGLRCLCSSGNEAELDDMLLTQLAPEAVEAIVAAMTAGMPDIEEAEKKTPADQPA